jgi:leucyl aminopeptidase
MQAASIDIVLDQHAGTLRAAPGRDGPRVVEVDLLPATWTLLREASQLRLPLRIVLLDALDEAALRGLEPLVPLVEIVAGMDRLEPPEGPAVFVAADRVLRARAAGRGWTPAPHPALALPVALGEEPVFVRLSGDVDAIRDVPGLVPYSLEHDSAGSSHVLAALTGQALARTLDARIGLQPLGLDVGLEDALFVQFDEDAHVGDALADYEVLWSDATRVLLALDATTTNDEIPAHGAHGHFRFLTPSPELLRAARVVALRGAGPGASLQVAAAPAPVTAASFSADVGRYAGLAPLDGQGPVRSRHSSHPDNARAVDALLAELTGLGYAPFTHRFSFGGRILSNVLADLPGSGEPGVDAGVIVVGCHLDSTAARDPGYMPVSDPARGADDDGSGMAALLAIARHLRTVGQPHHTVRFGFFNAEESGLVGSRAYAASLKAAGAAVTAVVCADMIAYNSDAQRTWELHAGFTDPRVRDLGVPLAQLVADAAAELGELPAPQIYTGTTPTGGTDPTLVDGAINRSDHASFQEQGYPAVLVSEDFFPNRPSEPAADPNPNYHSNADAVIDAGYAAAITRAMSVAVAELAARPGVLLD